MSYYNKQSAKVAIMSVLVEKGWKVYGYKPDQSDMMTDYYSPAHWDGVAEKNGFVLLVDQYSTHYSGYEVKKYNYNVKGTSADNYKKIEKLKATLNDNAASENEKEICKRKIEALENKEPNQPTYKVLETYPVFYFANPKSCTWHIEKDGEIIAKGKGLTTVYECNSQENTEANARKFVAKIEKHIADNTQLEKVIVKSVKKVIKPVEVTDRQTIQKDDVLSFDYHGHFWKVTSVYSRNDGKVCATYEILGSEKRGYQTLKNASRYYDYMERLEKNIQEGKIKIHTLQEVEEVTEKVTYKKTKRKQKIQEENLLTSEEVAQPEKQEQSQNEINEQQEMNNKEVEKEASISFETGTGAKGNGIEITFNEKPSEEVRNVMKANGYRWGGKKRPSIWWAILDENTLSLAKQLAGEGQEETNEHNSKQGESLPLNDIAMIMNDIKQIEDITAAQAERIEQLLTHWNNKEMAVLKEIYKHSNGNIIFKCEDKREYKTVDFRYGTIFVTGESGFSTSENDMKNYGVVSIYNVEKAKNQHNSAPVKEQEQTQQETFTYPEIDIDDNESYTISKDLQKREHDANWIFRRGEKDHTKEIQEIFQQYTDNVKEVICTLENEYYIYKIKSALQSFKKKYHSAYINWLSAKASQPHWAVSGRGNLNKSRYEKALNRQDKWMFELVELPKELESTINRYRNKARKDKEEQLKAQLKEELKQPLPELKFKTVTKEFDLYGRGTTVKTRFYECEGYSIAKVWGAFRVFDSAGKEIYSTKSNGTLKDAKAYVQIQIKKERQKAS